MRYLFLFPLVLLATTSVFAQTDTNQTSGPKQIFTYVEKMPEPRVNIQNFLSSHLKYPEDASKAQIEGRVVIRFVVDSTGAVGDVHVVKGVHPALDSESVRVVRLLPRWNPGEQDGRKVNVYYTLPVSFKLHETARMTLVKPRNGEQVAMITRVPAPHYKLDSVIKAEMRYGEQESELGIRGKVTIKCQMGEDGRISKPEVYRSVYSTLDNEALRIVSLLPPWEPAYIDDEPVAVYQLIEVDFTEAKVTDKTVTHQHTPAPVNVDQMPVPGVNISEYLQRNLRYPKEARDYRIQGRVIVRFIIDEQGHVTGVHTHEPLHFALDREARRVVEQMPAWKPGMLKGKPARVRYTLPITFYLQ